MIAKINTQKNSEATITYLEFSLILDPEKLNKFTIIIPGSFSGFSKKGQRISMMASKIALKTDIK